ncbi:MAG: methylmalonyl-CoA mutase, partial [Anaerophaga sp.]|nr:methylmalonyl-CoA mutase [Anaerophaga sp.]
MRPDFSQIDYKSDRLSFDVKAWEQQHSIKKDWITPEQIPVKPVYSKEDLEGMEHLNYA